MIEGGQVTQSFSTVQLALRGTRPLPLTKADKLAP